MPITKGSNLKGLLLTTVLLLLTNSVIANPVGSRDGTWNRLSQGPANNKQRLSNQLTHIRRAINAEHSRVPLHLMDMGLVGNHRIDMDDEFDDDLILVGKRGLKQSSRQTSSRGNVQSNRSPTSSISEFIPSRESEIEVDEEIYPNVGFSYPGDNDDTQETDNNEEPQQEDRLLYGGYGDWGHGGGGPGGYGDKFDHFPSIIGTIQQQTPVLVPIAVPVYKQVPVPVPVPQPVQPIQPQPQVQPIIIQQPSPTIVQTGGQPQQQQQQTSAAAPAAPQQQQQSQTAPTQSSFGGGTPGGGTNGVGPDVRAQFPTNGGGQTPQFPTQITPQVPPQQGQPQQFYPGSTFGQHSMGAGLPFVQPAQITIKHQVPQQKIHIVLTEKPVKKQGYYDRYESPHHYG